MALITRVKNLLVSPKTEWQVIDNESLSGMPLITSYLLPLALAAAVATLIGFGFLIGSFGLHYGLIRAVVMLIQLVLGVYINALVTDALAPSFASQKDINKSIQLVVYAATPLYVGSILNIIPIIGSLGSIVGLIYSVYLFYIGIPILKKTPEDKVPIYLIAIVLVLIVVGYIIQMILFRVFFFAGLGGLSPIGY